MTQWHRLAGGALIVGLLTAVAGQATASPLVAQWSYEINNAFESFDPVPGVVGSDTNAALGLPTRIEWPASGPVQSSLEVDGVQTGNALFTDGLGVAGATLTHNNAPIPLTYESQFLTGGRLRVQVDLTPAGVGATAPITVETFFDFVFKETPNTGSCGFASTSSCDDIFVLTNSGDLSRQFTFAGETYTLIFGSTQLSTLDPAACALLGFGGGCLGFLTAENASTSFGTFVRIAGPSVVDVPEPAPLALLGAGLLILGAVRRRVA